MQFINDRPKPLALCLFSRNKKTIKRVIQEATLGMMAVNHAVVQFAHPHLPIGGFNNRGIEKTLFMRRFHRFSNGKVILKLRTGLTTIKMMPST
ncbi:MAG: aldehyde dehydrogenase family protein [Bacteroidota bacterium]